MASFSDREAFIPYRRSDLVQLCIRDGKLSPQDADQFTHFCDILSAYYHFKFQKELERLKANFAPLDPDSDTQSLQEPSTTEQAAMEKELVSDFTKVLESANYSRLTETDLKKAFDEESLIPLKTDVDFEDYEPGRIIFYHRGARKETVKIRRLWKKTDRTFDSFERVVLMIKFKPADHFTKRKQKVDDLNFSPGKMYVYLYKKIPKFDLDVLFPNVNVSMNWKDMLKFGVPAVGALVPILIKTLPNLILIAGIVAFFTIGPSAAARFGANEQTMNNLFPILTAILSAGFMLGGYAFKQYMNYKNKRLKFLKNVTDTLFFKSLDCNAGVFHRLVDEAEEEETKEIILVYYFLLTHPGLTKDEIDDRIELWMEEKFGHRIDFNVDKAFANLQELRAEESLVTVSVDGRARVMTVPQAKTLIDYLWDNLFSYNTKLS